MGRVWENSRGKYPIVQWFQKTGGFPLVGTKFVGPPPAWEPGLVRVGGETKKILQSQSPPLGAGTISR
jgi:hypothetical protein